MGWGSTMVQEAKPSQGTTKLEVWLGDCEYEKAVGIYCSPRKGLWGEDGQFLRAFSTHSCSVAQSCLFVIPWTAAHQVSLSFIIFRTLLKLMSIESVMPLNHLACLYPLLLPSMFPSIRVFSNESALRLRWQSIGVSASASVLPMNTQD